MSIRQTPPDAIYLRSAQVRAVADSAEGDEIEVVFSTGAEVIRQDFWTGERWSEALDISDAAIDRSRLDGGMPLLRDHDATSTDAVIGVAIEGSARIDGDEAIARFRLSGAPSAADTVQKIREKTLRNVSVGYRVSEWKTTKAAGGKMEQRRAVRWTPYEVSAVAVPADARAQIRSATGRTFEELPMINAEIPAVPAVATRAEILAADKTRRTEIDRLGVALSVDVRAMLDNPDCTVEHARAQILDAKIAADKAAPVNGAVRVAVGTEERDHRRHAMQSAIRIRAAGGLDKDLTDDDRRQAQQFRGLTLAESAREILRLEGRDVSHLSGQEVIRLAMRTQSSSDFPLMLAGVVEKSLLASYAQQPAAYKEIAIAATISHLRTRKPTLLSGVVDLEAIAEGADYPMRPLLESQESYTLEKRGQIIGLTLEAMIKDDLSGFSRIPMAFAEAAVRRENNKVFGLLNTNGAMADSVALFHATHDNLITAGGAAPSFTTLDATEKLIALQTGLNGELLALEGAILVVPRALKNVAEQLFSPRYVPTAATGVLTGNLASLKIVSHPILDGTSATVWYMFADPAKAPVIEYATPSDTAALTIEEEEGFNNDTKKFKVRHWFGAQVVDFRGAAKNPGV